MSEHASTHDFVTGLPMPSFFEEEANHLLSFCKRTHANVALIYFSISSGHAEEEVFYTISERLTTSARESDLFARLGASDFACLSVETSPDHIHQLTDKIRKEITEPICLPDGSQVTVDVHIGVGRFPATSQNYHELLDHARNDAAND